jgi:hypothetical protein
VKINNLRSRSLSLYSGKHSPWRDFDKIQKIKNSEKQETNKKKNLNYETSIDVGKKD